MTVCMKCREPNHMIEVADAGGQAFMRCEGCRGMAMYRKQTARGCVSASGIVQSVVETAGEIRK